MNEKAHLSSVTTTKEASAQPWWPKTWVWLRTRRPELRLPLLLDLWLIRWLFFKRIFFWSYFLLSIRFTESCVMPDTRKKISVPHLNSSESKIQNSSIPSIKQVQHRFVWSQIFSSQLLLIHVYHKDKSMLFILTKFLRLISHYTIHVHVIKCQNIHKKNEWLCYICACNMFM